MSSVYYEPEKFGLTEVAEVDAAGGYSFDKFVIWSDSRGGYRWASDSGCSCPIPFEAFNLSNLPLGSLRDALTDLDAWVSEQGLYWPDDRAGAADKDDIRRLREQAGEQP